MKAIAYSIKQFERDLLEEVNQGRHSIEFVEAALSTGTADYAKGYDAVVVFTNDDVSAPVIAVLAKLGVKFIATRSVGTDHIDFSEAKKWQIKVANIPAYSPQAVAEHAVALAMALARKLIPTYDSCRDYDFRVEGHMGFNFYRKVVGIIGLGNIGQAAAAIFNGLGCSVLGYDVCRKDLPGIEFVDIAQIYQKADVITLHVPFNADTRYLINKDSISQMKTGVMLINTSRGGVINTREVLEALTSGKIGFLGLDVYEYEKGLFFEDHRFSTHKDAVLMKLMDFPNVVITPHQAFLTKEAVGEIAISTIENLNNWENGVAAGNKPEASDFEMR